MKILFPNAYYDPEQVANSHLMNDLEAAISKEEIEYVLYVPSPTRGIDSNAREKYKNLKYEERNKTVKIHRFSMYREGKNPVLRAVRYVFSELIQYFKCTREKDVDVVFTVSTPPTAGMLGAFIKKTLMKKYKKDVKFVYNLQDIFPESLVHTGLCKKTSLLYKLGGKIADFAYKNADKIIVISQDFKRTLLERGVPEEKIELIYNWVDENAVTYVPRSENPLFDKYSIDRSKFCVSYSGNIGLTQNMDMLLEVAEELKENKNICFILVGNGAYRDEVEKIKAKKDLHNVVLVPYQPYEQISDVFSLGDVGLLISKAGVGSACVPSKTWSYMSAERPVLASFDTDSELRMILDESCCGVCVAPDDKDKLKEAILQMASSELSQAGKNGRKFVIENVSKEKCVNKYLKVFKDIVCG